MILGMIIIISILNVIGSNLTSYSVLHKHWHIDSFNDSLKSFKATVSYHKISITWRITFQQFTLYSNTFNLGGVSSALMVIDPINIYFITTVVLTFPLAKIDLSAPSTKLTSFF